MTRRPGRSSGPGKTGTTFLACSLMSTAGTNVAPICCVMPPASPRWTFVCRILSRIFVLPVGIRWASTKRSLMPFTRVDVSKDHNDWRAPLWELQLSALARYWRQNDASEQTDLCRWSRLAGCCAFGWYRRHSLLFHRSSFRCRS